MSSIDDILKKNRAYAAGFERGTLPDSPPPKVAVVTCMDARILPGPALGLTEGDVHVVRNAGAVVTDDVLRSLTISQRLLGTRQVMIIAHTHCGMLTFSGRSLRDTIEEETGLRPTFAMESFSDLRAEVSQSVTRVRRCPFLPYRDEVRGFIFDVETGALEPVD